MDKQYAQIVFSFLIFIILGSLIVGSPTEKSFILANDECFDETDNDNDGDEDIFEDLDCMEYPYEDGSGEIGTPQAIRWTSNLGEYQSGYDIFADYTKNQINKACGGVASSCGIPNVNNEVDFFCYIENNANTKPSQLVQSWATSTNNDDGSYQMIQDLCYVFGGSGLTELPVLNYQQY